MKKGFTLVELAIVLVVIGLLMAIMITSASIITSARIRSDIAKLKKFQTATALYYAVNEKIPDENPIQDCYINYKKSYAPYVTESDYIISSSVLNARFAVGRSYPLPNNYIQFNCDVNKLLAPRIYLTSTSPVVNPANPGETDPAYFPRILACNIENILDDRSLKSGSGRAQSYNQDNLDKVTKKEFDNCKQFAINVKNGFDKDEANTTIRYFYELIYID